MNRTSYDPGVPAHHFGTMLRDAVDAIRPHSSRSIVTAGLASGDPGYLRTARDADGGPTVDAVAVHPYGQRAPDGWPNSDWRFGDMSDLFDRYLAFGLPLWVSEVGTVDEVRQAAYLENVYQLARDEYPDDVEIVFWFCWSDGMVPPFGLPHERGAQARLRAVRAHRTALVIGRRCLWADGLSWRSHASSDRRFQAPPSSAVRT